MKKLLIILVVVAIPIIGFIARPHNTEQESKYVSDYYYTYTPSKFSQSIEKGGVLLLNFYADWCSTCSELEPIVRDTLAEVGGSQDVIGLKVNFGDNQSTQAGKDLAKKYGVNVQSTLVVLTSKGVVKSFVATASKQELKDALLLASSLG